MSCIIFSVCVAVEGELYVLGELVLQCVHCLLLLDRVVQLFLPSTMTKFPEHVVSLLMEGVVEMPISFAVFRIASLCVHLQV